MTDDFNKWWDEDDLTTEGNNFVYGTPAYWAWEGWCAGAKAEREACAELRNKFHPFDLKGRQEIIGVMNTALDDYQAAIRARGEQA
jgi:hypothetical protein